MSQKPYFDDHDFTLYLGDRRSVLQDIPEGSVDLIFADPPYNLSNGGFTCHAGRRSPVNKGEWDVSSGAAEDFSFHDDWISACRRVLSENGSIWISGTSQPGTSQPAMRPSYGQKKAGTGVIRSIIVS
jgi:site-specific DNA-methyltransferase (adenine-specific)